MRFVVWWSPLRRSCALFVVVALRLALTRGVRRAGLLSVGVGRHGVGDFNFSLGVKFG